MDIIKDISSVLSLIVTIGAVCALLSKTIRSALKSLFFKNGGEQIEKDVADLKRDYDEYTKRLDKHIEEDKKFRENMENINEIMMEFIKTQCRNIIKDIYNKYCDIQRLPYYDYKVLLCVEDLYVKRANGNSFAVDMLAKMKTWDVDYSQK